MREIESMQMLYLCGDSRRPRLSIRAKLDGFRFERHDSRIKLELSSGPEWRDLFH